MSGGLVALGAAGLATSMLIRRWLRSARSQRMVRHWCFLAAETGAYVSVPSRPTDWRSLTLRHRRTPFAVRAIMSAGARGAPYIELGSSFSLGASSPSFSLSRAAGDGAEDMMSFAGFTVDSESGELPSLLAAAEDQLLAASDHIDWLQVHERTIVVRTNLGPLASVDDFERCLEVVYALAGDDQRGIEAMRQLPALTVQLDREHQGYPRVVVAVPTPVELSIRTDHDAPRTVAAAEASREGADFSCDIGADGRVSGRPATLIDETLHEMLPALALCRLRKRGNRVELVWPRVESDPRALMAGARLLASFRESAGPYR